jgi:hypothetical protein
MAGEDLSSKRQDVLLGTRAFREQEESQARWLAWLSEGLVLDCGKHLFDFRRFELL